jgi:uncharacterized metal-binding protein
MNQKSANKCAGGPKLIFACSGAADVGEISDRAARNISRDGAGKMFCLAGIGGRIPGIMKTTQGASKILAIDGCELDCVKNCLQQAGFDQFEHFRVTDLGLQKGHAEVNNENIAKVVTKGKEMLGPAI